MRLGVLFSGGKDSTLALHYAKNKEEVVCLITLVSKNKESYMFHTPNIDVTHLQAEALDLPQIAKSTMGEKEKELLDLKEAIAAAARKFQIQGVVTGAVESVYQAERVQRICNKLDLWCFNPLWKRDQKALLEELLERRFKVVISGVFAYPLDEEWLGKQIDAALIGKLLDLQKNYGISPSGEGGEIETTVLDAPLFRKKIEVLDYVTEARGNSGVFKITKARLVEK
ncbi:MAG TPA: diphthine--ammonia ligase [Candidatus Limnocylindrales bacterium]|nr:diphthine--ammonia ligase [Candidatus Limnocylindrales bacterium]